MMHAFSLNVALFFVFITSPSILCNGLMRKLNSETDPIVLTCRKVTDFGFCVYTLRSDSRSAGASTEGLAQIALDKLGAHSSDTSKYLQALQKSTPVRMKRVVDTCIHLYVHATDKDVPAAVKSLNVKAYGNAEKAASAAMMDEEGCKEVINKNPSPNWQLLTSRNKFMYDLSQLSSDLIGLLR